MTISERLLRVRKKTGLTQANFAKECEVSSRAYASYELGDRDLPISVAVILCKKYKTNAHWLLTGDGAETVEDIIPVLKRAREYAEEFRKNSHHELSESDFWKIQAHAFMHYSAHGFERDEGFRAMAKEKYLK